MEAVKNKFLKELSDLKQLISFYESESKLLADFSTDGEHMNFLFAVKTSWPFIYSINEDSPREELIVELSNKLRAFHISKRQFNYNSIVISLYGSLERFIEDCIIAYVEEINKIHIRYSNLPDVIIKNHFNLSLELIKEIEKDRYDGPLRKEGVIKNLNDCLNIDINYSLNKEAFALHGANFRSSVIDYSFNSLGVEKLSSKILTNSDVVAYTIKRLGLNIGDDFSIEQCYELLNNLAERRNDVAHGVVSEILQNNILLEYVSFLEIYGIALVDELNSNLLFRERDERGTALGKLVDAYSNNVICIRTNKISIKVGDTLMGSNKKQIVKAKIIDIQLDGVSKAAINDTDDFEIGIKMDISFKKNFNVHLINK